MKKQFWLKVGSIIFLCLVAVVIVFTYSVSNKGKEKVKETEKVTSSILKPETEEKESNSSNSDNKVNSEDIHPLLMGFGMIVGGTSEGNWINAETISKYIKGGEKYKVYAENQFLGDVVGTEAYHKGFISGETGYYINFGDKDQNKIYKGIFCIAGNWNIFPRIPSFELDNLDKYKDSVKKIKPQLSNFEVREAIRVDLDDDGVNELIINASQITDDDLKTICSDPSKVDTLNKKISVIILIKLKEGSEDGFCLFETKGARYNILSVADLNNDNQMEILVETIDYGPMEAEGFAFVDEDLISVIDSKVTKLLHVFWHPFLKNYKEEEYRNK